MPFLSDPLWNSAVIRLQPVPHILVSVGGPDPGVAYTRCLVMGAGDIEGKTVFVDEYLIEFGVHRLAGVGHGLLEIHALGNRLPGALLERGNEIPGIGQAGQQNRGCGIKQEREKSCHKNHHFLHLKK